MHDRKLSGIGVESGGDISRKGPRSPGGQRAIPLSNDEKSRCEGKSGRPSPSGCCARWSWDGESSREAGERRRQV